MLLVILSLIFQPITYPIALSYQAPSLSTPIRELEKSHKVTRGFMCWHPFVVKCIDDICGDGNKSYWVVKVNGDSLHYNANSPIKPTDLVEWEYVSSEEI